MKGDRVTERGMTTEGANKRRGESQGVDGDIVGERED